MERHLTLRVAAGALILLLLAAGLVAWRGSRDSGGGTGTRGDESSRGAESQAASVSCNRPYSRASPWNMPIPSGAASLASSKQLIRTISGPLTSDPTQYTYPVYTASRRQVRLPVYVQNVMSNVTTPQTLRFSSSGAQLRVPIPVGAREASGSDGSLIVLDATTHEEWGFWQFSGTERRLSSTVPAGVGSAAAPLPVSHARGAFAPGTQVAIGVGTQQLEYARIVSLPDPNHVVLAHPTSAPHAAGARVWSGTAENGYHYDTAWNGVPPSGFGSRGAGVPYLAGLVRRCELASGRINHALAFAYAGTASQFVYPARKSDGDASAGAGLPEGSRLQLDPKIPGSVIRGWGCRSACFTIARALQRYGMYLVDSSGRAKILIEDQATARWGGRTSVDASTVSPIPVSALRVVAPPGR